MSNFMLMLRLSRVGKTKQPYYRLIVSEKGRDPWGKYLEMLGSYNPRSNPRTVEFNGERIKYWLSKGAQASATVHNLLVDNKIITQKKVNNSSRKLGKRKAAKIASDKATSDKAAAAAKAASDKAAADKAASEKVAEAETTKKE